MPMILAEDVVKSYGRHQVLKYINLQVEAGRIFALLGPNGAGKTTFVKSILNLVRVDGGQILVNGISAQQHQCRRNLCFIPEKFNFYPYYTVEDALRFFAHMQGVGPQEIPVRVQEALTKFRLQELRSKKLKVLSKGNVQRVGLAQLIISPAELFLLDEPFSGLDPIGIKELKDLIKELKQAGKTIFLNSHILSEMEQICDDFAILNDGQILAQGSLSQLCPPGHSLEQFFYNTVMVK